MTKEDIKKAATEYANEACRPLWRTGNEQVCMVDFIEGAQWRINSVWHTYEEAKDVDLERTDIVIVMYPHNIYKIGKLSLYQHKKTNPETGMQEIVQEVALERPNNMVCLLSRCKGWAYIKDLIPNKE